MTIKETAGKILLYVYQLHRTAPFSMQHRQLAFVNKKNGGVSLTSDKKWLTSNLIAINPISTDIFNAFIFLLDKGFVESKVRASSDTRIYVGIQLTNLGIDMIEGVEQGQEGKQAFNVNFNIKVGDNTTVEDLISENLSKLISSRE